MPFRNHLLVRTLPAKNVSLSESQLGSALRFFVFQLGWTYGRILDFCFGALESASLTNLC